MSATTAAPATAIRRLALPLTEPAYEEMPDNPQRPPRPGLHGRVRSQGTQGSLALSYLLPSGVPAVPEVATSLRLVDLPRGGDAGPEPRRPPTGSARLPDPHRWSARLAQGIVEVLHGHRPLQQLVRWTDESVYAMLARRLAARRPRTGSRPLVRSIRVCEPRDGVVEVSVVVEAGHRCRALAMRLEGLDGRWCCTVLDIL
jgi:Family of unknown function (DUF6459)